MRGSLERVALHARALEGNVLGDPADRELTVYLPPGYREGTARYPVAYFLHAFMSSGQSWTSAGAFSRTVPERLDALIASGALPPMLAAFPDGATSLGGTQWNNSPAVGRYQDYLVQDVLPAMDGRYRTVASAGGRMALGRSSGGYGALLLGRDHPELFGHIASSSGDAYFEYCYLPDFPKAAAAFVKAPGLEAWLQEVVQRAQATKLRGEDFPALNILAMAASYSPRAGAELGLELPFELPSGRIREDVFSRWLAEDPVRFAKSHGDRLRKLVSVFLDCGTRDEYNLRWGTRMLAEGLLGQQVPVVHEEFDDGHMGTNYRFDRALAIMAPMLTRS